MQSDHPRLRAVRLAAVKHCVVPRAVKQSSLPQGCKHGYDEVESCTYCKSWAEEELVLGRRAGFETNCACWKNCVFSCPCDVINKCIF